MILENLKTFIDSQGLTMKEVERVAGLSNGVLSKAINAGTSIRSDSVEKILSAFPELSPHWLLSGEGQMLKYKHSCIGYEAKQETPTSTNPIPLVTEKAAAGFGNNSFAICEDDIKDYYIIPKFRFANVDFMIEVSGLSMYPHFKSGDIIACTILHDAKFIQWNRCHVIATRDQGILVKRIMPGTQEGSYLIVSDNKEYPPFELPISEITGIALVVGCVSLE